MTFCRVEGDALVDVVLFGIVRFNTRKIIGVGL